VGDFFVFLFENFFLQKLLLNLFFTRQKTKTKTKIRLRRRKEEEEEEDDDMCDEN
jgi:hypothetical protein